MTTKKIQDQSNVQDQEALARSKRVGKRQGIAQKEILEALPEYKKSMTETVLKGSNNSFIVLGRDRPGNMYSGYGGRGATGAGRIDLIAGLSSSDIKDGRSENPNFALDAARIYVSQKADIDRYMGLAETPRQAPPGRSTVGIKADTVRLHAREDIKIVTGRARFEGLGRDGEKLSNGGKNEAPGTISLLAGNYTEDEKKIRFNFFNPLKTRRETVKKLQPVPKGENLRECLESIIDSISRLTSMVGENAFQIQMIDKFIATHTHQVTPGTTPPFLPIAAPPLPLPTNFPGYPISAITSAKYTVLETEKQLFQQNLNLLKTNYLNKNFSPVHINSRHVFTT